MAEIESIVPDEQEDPIEALKEPLKTLVDEQIRQPVESDRLAIIRTVRRNLMFGKGEQFLVPKFDAETGVADWAPVESTLDQEEQKKIRFCYPINITRGDGQKFKAVVGNRPPNTKCVADDIEDNQLVQRARRGDAAKQILHKQWDAVSVQKELADNQWYTGPTFGHIGYVADGDRFGYSEEPNIGTEMQLQEPGQYNCSNCGARHPEPMCACGAPPEAQFKEDDKYAPVPVELGPPTRYANGAVELTIYNALHITVPFEAKALKECGFLICDEVLHKAPLLALYRKQLKGADDEDNKTAGRASSTAAAEAQYATQSPGESGRTMRSGYWMYSRVWLRPFMYELLPKAIREQCRQQFPSGMKIVFVGDTLVEIVEEKIDDHWAVCKSGMSEYIMGDPLCADAIDIQKALNDFFNLAIETVLRAIPRSIADRSLLDWNAFQNADALPAEVIPTAQPQVGDLSRMIGKLPTAEFSPQLTALAEMLRAYGQDISGIRPEIYGGGEIANTFREAKQRKDQALMQLQPAFAQMQRFWEDVDQIGVKEWARCGCDTVRKQSAGSVFSEDTEEFDVAELSEGGVHFEADEGYPMSYAEEVAQMEMALQQYQPPTQELLGLMDPLSVPRIHQLLGMRGIKAPLADEVERVESIIRRLIEEEPVEQLDPMTGMPTGIFMPSIEPDPVTDNPSLYSMLGRKWLISPRGMKLQQSKPAAYQNVYAWTQAQMAAVPPPMPAEATDQTPGKEPQPEKPQEPSPAPMEDLPELQAA